MSSRTPFLSLAIVISLSASVSEAQNQNDPQPYQQLQQAPQAYPQPQQQAPKPYPQPQQNYAPQQQLYHVAPPQQAVFIDDFSLPDNKLTIEPIDLFLFGTINIEYERAMGDYFSLALGAHLNLWEPLEGDYVGHSFRFAPRIYPLGAAPTGLYAGARLEYLYLTRADGASDYSDSGAAVGGFLGYDFSIGEFFVLSLAVGASYSTLGNPGWTLYAPSMKIDSAGRGPSDGEVIPYFRLGIGAAF